MAKSRLREGFSHFGEFLFSKLKCLFLPSPLIFYSSLALALSLSLRLSVCFPVSLFVFLSVSWFSVFLSFYTIFISLISVIFGESFSIPHLIFSVCFYLSASEGLLVGLSVLITLSVTMRKKNPAHLCTHITSKQIELEGPGWSRFVRF